MKTIMMKLIFIIFYPLAWIYESIYSVRRFCYLTGVFKSNSFSVPIISIGNLTFGGTGKTPFTIWLGNYLNSEKMKVMIMMRGHKGALEQKFGILHTERTMGRNPYEYGDEALVLAKRLDKASIVVGKNRSENLKYYFKSEQPDVVILDDGHQHLKLNRSFNILLFDSLLDIKKYKVPPFGYLREGLTALKDAHFIILGRSNQVTSNKKNELKQLIKKYNPHVPIAEVGYKGLGLFNFHHQRVFELSELKDRKVICFSGIASPESFYKMIENYGCNIIYKESFLDHHFFTESEAMTLLHRAKKDNAILVTTEKDMVKIARVIDDPCLVFLKIGIEFFENEDELKGLIRNI